MVRRIACGIRVVLGLVLSGCAGWLQVTGWEPPLDHPADERPGSIAFDVRSCQAVAASYTGIGAADALPVVMQTAVGLLSLGAVRSQARDSGEAYRRVFAACLAGRGHRPLDGAGG